MVQPSSGPGTAAATETLAELNVEARTNLAFAVSEAAVERLLPAGWKAAPAAAGPLQGANLLVVFADRLLVQAGDGQPLPGQATNQIAVIAVPAQHPPRDARGVMIAFGLSARAEGTPGPYGVFVPARATVERVLRSGPGAASDGEEQWSFAGDNGNELALQVRYARGIPVRSDTETRAYSAADPNFYRTYRADQGAVILRGGPSGMDALSAFEFNAAGPLLGGVFDGSERLVSVLSLPWTVRRAFLPGSPQ